MTAVDGPKRPIFCSSHIDLMCRGPDGKVLCLDHERPLLATFHQKLPRFFTTSATPSPPVIPPTTTGAPADIVSLQDHWQSFVTPRCLLRYAVASHWDIDKALRRLLATFEWRTQHLPTRWGREDFSPCLQTRFAEWKGKDKDGNPILDIISRNADCGIPCAARIAFMFITLEKGIRYMHPDYSSDQHERLQGTPTAGEVGVVSGLECAPPATSSCSASSWLLGNVAALATSPLNTLVNYSMGSTSPDPMTPPSNRISSSRDINEPDQWVMIVDEKGKAAHHNDTGFVAKVAPVLVSHYVERLKAVYIVDAGPFTRILLAAVRLCIDQRTANKIILCSSKSSGRDIVDVTNETGARPVRVCERLLADLGPENIPASYGGQRRCLDITAYEDWFHAMPPHPQHI